MDPEEPSDYDANVDQIIENSRNLDVPFVRVNDSVDIAEHAASIGLLPSSAVDDVRGDVRRDLRRDTLVEEADLVNTR